MKKRRVIIPEELSCRTSHNLGKQDPWVGRTLRDQLIHPLPNLPSVSEGDSSTLT